MKEYKVFMIDDEESMRISVSQYLSLANHEVTCFGQAKSALSLIDDEFNGVIISDIRMPQMDGLELLEQVKIIDKEIPVILITAHGDISMAVSAIRTGAYDFIEKPFDPDNYICPLTNIMNPFYSIISVLI